MQRIFSWLLLIATLYVSGPASASDEAQAASAVPAVVGPHIALLLPLKSPVFGRAADAVRQGFLAAANSQAQPLPVQIYACTDEKAEISSLYLQAIARGARAVVGPLTHNGVEALAGYSGVVVPTLALNTIEGESAVADQLYFFGLPAEAEARQIAQLATAAGLHNAYIISDGTPLSSRLALAFAGEWEKLGGSMGREIVYQDDPSVLADMAAEKGNMVFLAADAAKAHLIRPYLDVALPVYATSQVFSGNANPLLNYDLNDVHFVDMPWLLQPDHPAVMIYPRPSPSLRPEMDRLYALGIDAFRLIQVMLGNTLHTSLPMDGVTGRITLNTRHQFEREAIPALFRLGQGLTPDALAAALREAARAAAASGVFPDAPAPVLQGASAVSSVPAATP